MHNPKFSIITVTFNAGKSLEKTIQSVISQTYRNVEYIIVDGKSKDNTLQIANAYQQWIHRLISEPDKGLYDAMNKGTRLATGDYLCFLNAGDKFHDDDTLQHMANSLKDGHLSVSLPCVVRYRRHGTYPPHSGNRDNRPLPSEFLYSWHRTILCQVHL